MDKIEAPRVLADLLEPYRNLPYADLTELVRQEPRAAEVTGSNGGQYQTEVMAVWDDRRGGPIRVLASVFDGGLRSAFLPLTEDFIKSPDGAFVGE